MLKWPQQKPTMERSQLERKMDAGKVGNCDTRGCLFHKRYNLNM